MTPGTVEQARIWKEQQRFKPPASGLRQFHAVLLRYSTKSDPWLLSWILSVCSWRVLKTSHSSGRNCTPFLSNLFIFRYLNTLKISPRGTSVELHQWESGPISLSREKEVLTEMKGFYTHSTRKKGIRPLYKAENAELELLDSILMSTTLSLCDLR